MSDKLISYPSDAMHTSSSSQSKTLDDAWQSHQSHINQHILTPASQLLSQASPIHSHITTWNQQLQDHYQVLHILADNLATGATSMTTQDQYVQRNFQQTTTQ